jgi:hypothetical protein
MSRQRSRSTPKLPPRRKAKPKPAPTLHRIKVTLRDSQPLIWRRFTAFSEIDLGLLHEVLQAVMGWTNTHLHQFEAAGHRISDPSFELDEDADEPTTLDERSLTLRDVAPSVGDHFVYEYDFGDGWIHDLVVEDIEDLGDRGGLVWCLEGARACPLDDCGGISGYEELLAALADRRHPEREELLAWAGGSFDPEHFDPQAVNRELVRWLLARE